MNDTADFQIIDPEYSICNLQLEHAASLQRLFEQCADFNVLVDGQDVSPTAGRDIFQEVPPGRSVSDKFLYGILDRHGELAGVLEGMAHYPEVGDWWIGLLLLSPGARGKGLGRRVVEGFADYVLTKHGKSLLLGVVEENVKAYRFWQQSGFEFVRQTEPRSFGRKMQKVTVMQRALTSQVVE